MDDSGSINKGMEVFDSTGAKIGTVARVFSGAPSTTDSTPTAPSAPPGTAAEYAPDGRETEELGSGALAVGTQAGGFTDAGTPVSQGPGIAAEAAGEYALTEPAAALGLGGGVALTPSDTKYIEIRHGGLLGIGGEHFYVPFHAVSEVNGGLSITLNCTVDDCAAQYQQEPQPID
jgi:hypothetical protein